MVLSPRRLMIPERRLAGADARLLLAVRTRHHNGGLVEDHGRNRTRFCGYRSPPRNAGVIGIAGVGEVNPRMGHPRPQGASDRAAPCHVLAAIGVVEDKWQLGAMKGSWTPIEDGCLPSEPVQIGGRAL